MTNSKPDETVDSILENWLDEAMGASLLSVGIDGYKGSEENIDERRDIDYKAALKEAKARLNTYYSQLVDQIIGEDEARTSPNQIAQGDLAGALHEEKKFAKNYLRAEQRKRKQQLGL